MPKNLLMTKERLEAQMTNVDKIRDLANRFQTNWLIIRMSRTIIMNTLAVLNTLILF